MKDQMGLTAIEREQRAKEAAQIIQRRPAANERQFTLQLRLDIA